MNALQQISLVPGTDASSEPFVAGLISLKEHNTPYIFLAGFSYQEPTGSSLAQAALQQMFAGRLTAAQAARQIQDGIALYFEPFRE